MTIDRGRVRRALSALDALVARAPRLTHPRQRARLKDALDDEAKDEDDGTRDGKSEEQANTR